MRLGTVKGRGKPEGSLQREDARGCLSRLSWLGVLDGNLANRQRRLTDAVQVVGMHSVGDRASWIHHWKADDLASRAESVTGHAALPVSRQC